MTLRIQECLTVSKDIKRLVECIAKEADEAVVNIKANGIALDELKKRLNEDKVLG